MKTIFQIIIIATITSFSYAQECKLKGVLFDDIGIPVTDASVTISDSINNEKGSATTNNLGEFEFNLPCSKKYEIEIERVDYETTFKSINLNENTNKRFILGQTKGILLNEAVVKSTQAIKVKGDTIEFDANSFKEGSEETLEDILKKLPGVEIQNGKMMYKGKPMTKVTVGGREVLGGNEKLLNKNLPSDVVSKIQLNTKLKSNPFASSIQQDEEQFSLNIELKEDAKRLAFGNVSLGGDAKKHTDAQAKTFYFSEQTDATLINDFNTFGKQVFDRDDYISFFGGYSEFNSEGSIYSLRENSSNLNLITKNDAPTMNIYNGAIHFGVEPNKKLQVSGFGLINKNNIRYESKEERYYNTIEIPYTTVDQEKNKSNVLMGISRLCLDYNPNGKAHIKYRLNLNYLDSKNEQLIENYYENQRNSFRRVNSKQENHSLSQTLSYIRKVGSDDNIGFYLRHQYQRDAPNYDIISSTSPFSSLEIFKNISTVDNQYNLAQKQKFAFNTIQLYSVYNNLLTNTSNIKIKAGTNFSGQSFKNTIYNFKELLKSTSFSSDTDLNYNETFIDATLSKKIEDFKIDLGAGVSFFNEKTNYKHGEMFNRSETKFLPHVVMQYDFNNATGLRASYTKSYSYPYTKDLNESYTIQNYQSLFYGNIHLRKEVLHTASLNFKHFDPFSFFDVFANLSYILQRSSIQTKSILNRDFLTSGDNIIVNVYQLNTLVNSNYNQETYNGNLMIGKRFTKWYKIRFKANLTTSNYYTMIGSLESKNGLVSGEKLSNVNNKIFNQTYDLENTFVVRKKLEFKTGLNLNLSKYNSLSEQRFTNWRPYAEMACSATKGLLIQSDFSYRFQYQNGEEINTAKEWNASARYNIAKKTYLTFIAGNLLGNNLIVSNSFNENYVSTITKNVLGRYFIVSLRYKF